METRADLIEYLVAESEGDYAREDLEKMTPSALLDTYLEWNGIIGWTGSILEVVELTFNVKLNY